MGNKSAQDDLSQTSKLVKAQDLDSHGGTSIADKRERKKRQNLLNQRASRRRKQQESALATDSLKRRPSYRVNRWRLNDDSIPSFDSKLARNIPSKHPIEIHCFKRFDSPEDLPYNCWQDVPLLNASPWSNSSTINVNFSTHSSPEPDSHYALSSLTDDSIDFPLSSDHLLINLVHHNTFRALITNKSILRDNTSLVKPQYPQPIPILHSYTNLCDGPTVIRPRLDRRLPPSLQPTDLQMTEAHASWIDMFPFPRLRDQLIIAGRSSDLATLCYDLFGELYHSIDAVPSCATWPSLQSSGGTMTANSVDDDDDDDFCAGRKCLVVWGDPWVLESWEVTPGFVRTWGWALNGCESLIIATNRRRAMRGEEPIVL